MVDNRKRSTKIKTTIFIYILKIVIFAEKYMVDDKKKTLKILKQFLTNKKLKGI